MSPAFKREELRARYDVETIHEDDWHSYSATKTYALLRPLFSQQPGAPSICLNAGSGVYELELIPWKEISVDLFIAPIRHRKGAVCASIESLPFPHAFFGGVVCTGEVLAYCDPAAAIAEFARVLAPSGMLVCDFGSSRSFRYWLKDSYGRAADLVTDSYNGAPERIWIYDPAYITSILKSFGFDIKMRSGTHTWSALARRVGASMSSALSIQRHLGWLRLPSACADIMTIVAVRT